MRPQRRPLSIDLTPMIDIIFLLLIFMLVSTAFKREELALLLDLPRVDKSNSARTTESATTLELTIDKLYFQGRELELEALKQELAQVCQTLAVIEFRNARDVPFERTAQILHALQSAGCQSLEIRTEPMDKQP